MNQKPKTNIFFILVFVTAVGLFWSTSSVATPIEETKEESRNEDIVDGPAVNQSGVVADAVLGTEDTAGESVPAVAGGAFLISGKRISGWKTDKYWPIASISKLVSAFVAERVMDQNHVIVFDEKAVETNGYSGNFILGNSFAVRDLVKAMLMVSSNDAAVAIAESYGFDDFIREMNLVALSAGAENTNFVDPTGLSVQNQSTVEDLVRIANYIWINNPEFFEISQQSTDYITDTDTGGVRKLVNINSFAGRPDFLGGKTGTLPESGGNLISLFQVAGYDEPVVVVVLGSKDRFKETEEILSNL